MAGCWNGKGCDHSPGVCLDFRLAARLLVFCPDRRGESLNANGSPPLRRSSPRRAVLVDSLRRRYRQADRLADAGAKRALFKEAVYLGISLEEFALQA